MAINLNDNINTLAPKPTDNRYGPYPSVASALASISNSVRHSGLTIGVINASNQIIEYWWPSGVSDSHLVVKTNSSSGPPVIDDTVVRTFGAQTIAGDKTFSVGEQGSFRVLNENIGSSLTLLPNADNGGNPINYILTTIAPYDTYPGDNFPIFVSLPNRDGLIALVDDIGTSLSGSLFSAGSGLQGGGDLSANRSFDIGQGDGISVLTNSISVDTTVVRTTGAQTIDGRKTFTSIPIFSGNYSNGQLLIGSGNFLVPNTLIAGTGIGISNGSGTITIDITGLPRDILSQTSLSGMAGIDVQYHSIGDTIVISSTGLSYVGHKHLLEDINVLSDFSMASFRITNLSTPVSGNDATNKTYVDSRYIQLGTTQINLGSSNSKSIIGGLDLDGGSP